MARRGCTPTVLLIVRCGNVLRLGRSVGGGTGATRAVAGATPQSEGLVRVRGEVEIHTSTPALLGSLPHQRSLAGRPSERRLGRRRIKPILFRLPPLPKLLAPLSCQRPPARSLASLPPATHSGLGPDTALRVCPYATAFVGVSPLVHGDRRFEAAIRLAENRDAPDVRALWPSCKGLLVQPQSAQRLA